MSAEQVAAGLRTIKGTFTLDGSCGSPNNVCHTWMWQQGPGGGLDPSSRFAVGDVRTFNDGAGANKQKLNVIKMQAAMEALQKAGVQSPTVGLAKDQLASVDPAVFVQYGATMPFMHFNKLHVDKQVIGSHATVSVPASSVAAGNTSVDTLQTFPNGISFVTAPDLYGRSRTGNLPGACRANPRSDAESSLYAPMTIAGQLNEDPADLIPFLSFWADPVPGGVSVTNLLPSGGDYLQALQTGNYMKSLQESGAARAMSGIPEAFQPYDAGSGPVLVPPPGTYGPPPSNAWTPGPAWAPASAPSFAPPPMYGQSPATYTPLPKPPARVPMYGQSPATFSPTVPGPGAAPPAAPSLARLGPWSTMAPIHRGYSSAYM
jgi:hypothetical protein